MAISYEKVSRTPYILKQLVGLAVDKFEKVVEKQSGKRLKEKRNAMGENLT